MTTANYRAPTIIQTLEEVSCWNCGITFAVPPWWKQKRIEDGQAWYCPNGHQCVYGEGENARLRRQLTEAQRSRDAAWRLEEQERRAHAATKGQLTRARRRAAHGVCPVPDCHRRPFDNLARHMAQKHPEYVAEADRAAGSGPQAAVAGDVRVDGPYGTMRQIASGRGAATRYACRCGWKGSVGGRNSAGRHARTCPAAREPWPAEA